MEKSENFKWHMFFLETIINDCGLGDDYNLTINSFSFGGFTIDNGDNSFCFSDDYILFNVNKQTYFFDIDFHDNDNLFEFVIDLYTAYHNLIQGY